MNAKQPAVVITDVDYHNAINRINELSEMNKRLEKSSIDRLVRAEAAEARAAQLEAERDEARRQFDQAKDAIVTRTYDGDYFIDFDCNDSELPHNSAVFCVKVIIEAQP